jgi:hypothetical protein
MSYQVLNHLTITGPAEDINRFIQIVDNGKNNRLDFNKLLPIPYNDLSLENYEDDRRRWMIANWGTVSGAYDVSDWNVASDKASVSYSTPGCPATEFFSKASEMFPTLVFRVEFADKVIKFIGYEIHKVYGLEDECEYDWNSDEAVAIQKNLGLISV